MQRWKRLLATGLVGSIALLGAACDGGEDTETTTTEPATTETEAVTETES